jgi:hypothetical protein
MSELSTQGPDLDDARRSAVEADRYFRRRQQEADLLVAKARRLLVAAEEKAAVIIATARDKAEHLTDPSAEPDDVIDLDALGAESALDRGGPAEAPALKGLDRLLASAIANAMDHAFAGDERP